MKGECKFEDESGFCLIGNTKDVCNTKTKYICGNYEEDEI